MIGQDGAIAARAVAVPAWPGLSARAPQARPPAAAGNSPRSAVTPGSPRSDVTAAPPGKASQISPRVFAGLIRIAEFTLLAALGFLIAYAYVAEFFRQYAAALSLTSLAAVTLFQALGLYSIPALASLHRQLPRLISGWMATLALLLCAVFFVKAGAEFSRAWLALWFMTGTVCLLAFRAGVAALARHRLRAGSLTRRAVVYGAGQSCEGLLNALESGPDSDIKICGVFDDRGDDRSGQGVAGYPKLGDLEALLCYCRSTRVDMLIVARRSRRNGVYSTSSSSFGYCRSTFAWRHKPPRCVSGHAPIPSLVAFRCSTSSTNRSRTGMSLSSGCSILLAPLWPWWPWHRLWRLSLSPSSLTAADRYCSARNAMASTTS